MNRPETKQTIGSEDVALKRRSRRNSGFTFIELLMALMTGQRGLFTDFQFGGWELILRPPRIRLPE
jgi:hypothetical protein